MTLESVNITFMDGKTLFSMADELRYVDGWLHVRHEKLTLLAVPERVIKVVDYLYASDEDI